MIGFLIGTVCLIGLVKVLRHGRRFGGWHGGWGRHGGYGGGCGHRGGGWDRDGWGDREGYGRGGGFGPTIFLRGLFERLDTSPGQEKVIKEAIEELRSSGSKVKDELRASRADVAKAVKSPSFDETVMGELFARHDTSIEEMRRAVVGAIGKVHAVLDDRQRERLAEMIESGPFGRGRGRWGGGGPYRGAWA